MNTYTFTLPNGQVKTISTKRNRPSPEGKPMKTVPPTAPKLLDIAHDGPVRVRPLGEGHEGFEWTVQPEDFESLIERVNQFGGPAMWEILPV